MKKTKSINIIRWTARIIGTLIVAFTLFMAMFEGYNKHGGAVSNTFDTFLIITFTFWGIGLAGLILALWKEGLGGIVSLVSFIIFIFLVGINPNPDASFSNMLFIYLIPSVLYLCYWWLTRKSSNEISHCPGEVCDVKPKQPIQKTSWAQLLIVFGFAAYILLTVFLFHDTFSVKPFDLFGIESAAQPE
jgi:hypothetical protein